MPSRRYFTLPDRAGNIAALELSEPAEINPPFRGELQVRVEAIGLNFADVFTGLGLYGPIAKGQVKGPFVPGLEFSGVVEQVGAPGNAPLALGSPAECLAQGGQLTDLSEDVWALAAERAGQMQVGDRVMGCMRFGAYATHLNVPAHQVKPIPDGWSFDEGAAFTCQSLTVYYALKQLGALERGHVVLVHSMAGGCGLQATAICFALGATVIGTVGSESKVAMLLERFPDLKREQIIVRNRGKFKAQLESSLKSVNSLGFDVVLDAVLGDFFRPGFDLMSPGGRYVVYGAADMTPSHASMGVLAWARLAWQWLRRPWVDPLDLPGVNKSVMGFNLIHCFNNAPLLLRLLDELLALGLPKPHVGSVLPFEDAQKALLMFKTGQTVGKVVLRVSH